MKITEPVSGKSMGILLADAVYYRNKTLSFNGQQVDVVQKTEGLLNMSFGNTGYYLTVKSRIREVSLNFVVDGSSSMAANRDKLASSIQSMISRVEKKLNDTSSGYDTQGTQVTATIYILSSNSGKCTIFDNLSDARIKCKVIGIADLYLNANNTRSPSWRNSNGPSTPTTPTTPNDFLRFYNMTPPISLTHNMRPNDLAEADWGYGTAYASFMDAKTTPARLTFIFPVGDELSTTSIPDTCFYKTLSPDSIVCALCDGSCSFDRSLKSVQKGIEVAKANRHVIVPIFSYFCNYLPDYDFGGDTIDNCTLTSGYNQWDTYDAYTRSFGYDKGKTLCDNPGCTGCDFNATAREICLHPTCTGMLLNQMELMANETGGRVIYLNDVAKMDTSIIDIVDNKIDQYAIEIGQKNTTLQRQVLETTQPIPGGQAIDVRLWVYSN